MLHFKFVAVTLLVLKFIAMVPLSGLLCTKCNRAFNSGDLYTHMRDCSCGFDQILFTPNAEDLHTLLVSKLRTVYVDYAASLLSYGVQLRECYSFNVTCHGTCVIGIQYWYYLALILYKIFHNRYVQRRWCVCCVFVGISMGKRTFDGSSGTHTSRLPRPSSQSNFKGVHFIVASH